MTQDERTWVKLDRYALADLGRQFYLTLPKRAALLTLTLGANYRSGEWTGTITDFAEEMGASPNTARLARERLEECGLIRTVLPFGGNRRGIVLVLAYGDLRVPSSKVDRTLDEDLSFAQICANEEPEARSKKEGSRNQVGSKLADLRDSVPADQPERASRGREDAGQDRERFTR
jgi:hypothetical protein